MLCKYILLSIKNKQDITVGSSESKKVFAFFYFSFKIEKKSTLPIKEITLMSKINLNMLNNKNDIPKEIIGAANGDEIVAKILYGRGYDSAEKISAFFLKDYIPLKTKDIKEINKAVQKIIQTIESNIKICIYGDYDVDGVTSTAILVECLRGLNADCIYHVPDRFTEGYGMNKEVIKSLADKDVKLIITCDCGISNREEVALANQLAMEVIVTDHHSIPEQLPEAYCMINPKLWDEKHKARNVSGAVVAYYLARALLESCGEMNKAEEFMDLLTLSIVADVVPLMNENRYLLKKGLLLLANSTRLGIKSLLEIATNYGAQIDEEFIGFQIAPRINAAGRMNSAVKAVELLLSKNKNEAEQLAQEINNFNINRKEVEAEIVKNAEEIVLARFERKNLIVLFDENWHHGVIGIAAGRICEKFNKPAILMGLKEDGQTVVGSARAPEGISIYNILKECEQSLSKFGGHSAAAGLSLNLHNLKGFIEKVESVARWYEINDTKTLNIDLELKFEDIDDKLINSLRRLAPFGEGFPKPIFLSKGAKIISNQPIKNIGRRIIFSDDSTSFSGIYWGDAGFQELCEKVDIVYTVQESCFRGQKEIKLNILHILRTSCCKATAKFINKDVEVIDLRDKHIVKNNLTLDGNEVVFYEGIGNAFSFKVYNRYEIEKAQKLIFVSTPPSLDVCMQILKKVEPERIELIFSDDINPGTEIIQKALGIAKYIVNKKEGKTSYEELTCLLGITFEITECILKFFHFSGLISFEEVHEDIIIYEGSGQKMSQLETYKRTLLKLIQEMNSFKKFIKTINAGNLKKYIENQIKK